MEDNEDSPLLTMPEVEDCKYLLEFLIDVGISSANGFGMTPLSWSELHSWSILTDTQLTSWDAATIIQLSRSFTSYFTKYDEKDFATPYQLEEFDREAVSQTIGSRLRMLAVRMKK